MLCVIEWSAFLGFLYSALIVRLCHRVSQSLWSSLNKLLLLLFVAYLRFLMCFSDNRSLLWDTDRQRALITLCVCVLVCLCACVCVHLLWAQGWQDTKHLLICLTASNSCYQSFINSLFTLVSFVLLFSFTLVVCYYSVVFVVLGCLW